MGSGVAQYDKLNGHAGKLNAMTLASGLDDYPRASTPGPDERHVDIVCWLAAGSRALSRLAATLGDAAGADSRGPCRHFPGGHSTLYQPLRSRTGLQHKRWIASKPKHERTIFA